MRTTTIALVTLISALSGAMHRDARAQEWKVGVASVVITPQEPVWLSGYASRTAPAEGKVHDLWAKAAAFEGRDGRWVVLVTMDLGSVSEAEITGPVAERVFKLFGLPREALILNVSHTHCAPEVAVERRVFHALADAEEAKLERYIGWLNDRLVKLIGDALSDLAPARLTVSKGTAQFGKCRRFPTEDGFVNQEYDEGLTDNDVPVLRVTAPDGRLRAVLFGYPCHNTTLAFQKFCGDYAGFAQQYVQESHPGATAMFVMGCGGDQNPYPRHGPMALDYSRAHGRELADAVEHALAGEQQQVHGPLRIAYEVATLDLEPLPPIEQLQAAAQSAEEGHPRRKARYLLGQLERTGKIALTQRCPLHAVRFGDDLLFIAISGETVVDYDLMGKEEFAGPFVWVAGYCDDVFAYLPSLRVLREGGYEGRGGIIHQLVATPFAENVEDRVMGGVRRLVQELTAEDAEGRRGL